MSTAVFLSHPAHGHINPTLPVVAELVRRGEKVVYYATDLFRAKVEATGAEYRSFGPQELFERQLAYGGIFGGMAGLIEATEEILPNLLAELRDDLPDYLLLEAHSVPGNLVQKILDLPAMTLCAMFAFNERLISPPALNRFMYAQAPAPVVLDGLLGLNHYTEVAQRISQRYGILCPNIIEYLSNPQPLNIVFTSQYFQIGGDQAFDDTYKFVGPSVTPNIETNQVHQDDNFPWDALTGQPLIYISMGTMYNADADFYHACFDAFADSPYQVVLSVGHRLGETALRQPPANFIVRQFVPQLEILQQAALFVTHGGMNSANEGILFHAPMLVLPQQADHYVVARQVGELGAGIVLDRFQATPEQLKSLSAQVLANPSYKAACEKIAKSLRAGGGYRRAADEILAYKERVLKD
ncbi:glycosyl transferase family 1 [Chloroflexi bacterium TSY]|nr:glycosyl transferase family 1 [Chloroflexi bacterium TSY]WAB21632.1 glycosyl Transferase 2 AtsG [Chloroflexota bacterium]